MTDTTKFASPVDDVQLTAAKAASGKTPAGSSKEKARVEVRQTIEEVGDSMHRRPARWGTAGAGLLAAATAVGALIWRRQRKPRTPREKAVRAWREATSRAGDVTSALRKRARLGR